MKQVRKTRKIKVSTIIFRFSEMTVQAEAVLSGSDEKNCNGFVKRQALYSCLTCAPEDSQNDFKKSIGICLACSLRCHEKHELVELYTKRNFHCDCGLKTGSSPCQIDPTKTTQTTNNTYNQNFIGLYCICRRKYPDPEDPNDDEMIQCIMCEDWYHSLHLNTKAPPSEAYDEMICGDCMIKNSFLSDYCGLAVKVVEGAYDQNESLNVSSLNESGTKRPADTEASTSEPKKMKMSEGCLRPKSVETTSVPGSATFWRDGWRKELCKCTDCQKVYDNLKVEFLVDPDDRIQVYEDKGKGKVSQSNYMASLEALSTLPRVSQIDAMAQYNRMKDKLFEFLQVNNLFSQSKFQLNCMLPLDFRRE